MSGIGIVSITAGSEATTSRVLRLGGLSYPTRGLHLTPAVYALPIQGKAQPKPGGPDLQHVLRFGIFLVGMNEFKEMNIIYQRIFGAHRPARTAIQVAALTDRATTCRDRLRRPRASSRHAA